MICQIPDHLILNALNPVILPALSGRVRSGGDLKEPYPRTLSCVTALQWPFLLCLTLLADPVIQVLLGAQWSAVAPIVRISALASLCLFPAFITYPLMVSIDRVRDMLMIILVTNPVIVVIFIASLSRLQDVAVIQFITASLQVYVALSFIRRQVPFAPREPGAANFKGVIIQVHSLSSHSVLVAMANFASVCKCPKWRLPALERVLGWTVGIAVTGHPLLAELHGVTDAFGRAPLTKLLAR